MPIYMDRHDIPKEITAEHVALMHQEDLKVEHLYGCKGMTYWCDTERHTAFCLIEAPNREAIQNMHNHAHGEFPHDIIEVDPHLVESFLGRIEDPQKGKNEDLNIIDDPAFRVIMVLETSDYLHRLDTHQLSIFTQKFHRSVAKSVKHFEASLVRENDKSYLISFKSVTNAVLCALKIQASFKYSYPKLERDNRRLKIGLCAGLPVTSKEGFFSESILLATQMCEIIQGQIVISSSVKSLYENENRNAVIDDQLIRTLTPQELSFVTQLVEFCECTWNKSNFNIITLSKELGHSKSQLYRKIKKLTGKSPITFIREYRLHRALELIHNQEGNISEIAFESGFNSAAYFSKSFLDKFGILPSKYAQMYQS
ncbi:nickel-binding protein [uncultured Eudoraea sp.]|uniref:nickel-binding protein n=1 Tax=uncultured Eudoraea sp. TaxID=1035614 RepID=UPI002608A310|nr:nickel-binding protein [uncultured Eudoraea sp.]